ncbi:SPOR domain-containing protein [Psychroflexus planctonicus]|uniref:SPOR domain-containing protein n=1 Tax=Psychroflexus planctonicus TaxID=1526575 RepID=UPI0016699015|nr:SPOR domain-containing protein [Psychroflexus planctonicus]
MPSFQNSFFLLLLTISLFANAQDVQNTNQDQQLRELIKIKKELTNSDKLKEFYKIQLYSGNLNDAEDVKKEFDDEFEISSTIKYETPNYKVWIGNFRTRLEADRAMLQISEVFESAFIIRPGRN